MAVTLSIDEAAPATWPDVSGLTLSTAAAALEEAMIWQRIESWIRVRWTSRAVTFVAEGIGTWESPLAPFTLTQAEVWNADGWEAVTLNPSPLGYRLETDCAHRIIGTVGDDTDPPAQVLEAFRRLAEYSAHTEGNPGASSFSHDVGPIRVSEDRNPAWLGRAMQYSGAADLLRPYRRLAA